MQSRDASGDTGVVVVLVVMGVGHEPECSQPPKIYTVERGNVSAVQFGCSSSRGSGHLLP